MRRSSEVSRRARSASERPSVKLFWRQTTGTPARTSTRLKPSASTSANPKSAPSASLRSSAWSVASVAPESCPRRMPQRAKPSSIAEQTAALARVTRQCAASVGVPGVPGVAVTAEAAGRSAGERRGRLADRHGLDAQVFDAIGHHPLDAEAQHFEARRRLLRQVAELEHHGARPGVGQHDGGLAHRLRAAADQQAEARGQAVAVGDRHAQRPAAEEPLGERQGMELGKLERSSAGCRSREGSEAQLTPPHREDVGRHRPGREAQDSFNPRR